MYRMTWVAAAVIAAAAALASASPAAQTGRDASPTNVATDWNRTAPSTRSETPGESSRHTKSFVWRGRSGSFGNASSSSNLVSA